MSEQHDKCVSIVMPAFNASQVIAESISSVLNQTYQNFELIIVDDSSTDNTREIISKFVNADSRVKLLVNNFEKGAAGARKTAIENSRGRYLAFLDSDDLWSEDKLESQISFIGKYGYPFVYSDYYTFENRIADVKSVVKCPPRISYKQMLNKCSIGCLTVMIDRNAFLDLEFPIHPKEDYVFWLKLLKKVDFAHNCPGVRSYYRLSPSSLSGNKFAEIRKQWSVVYEYEQTSLIKSIFCIFNYSLGGVFKHYLSPIFYRIKSTLK